MRLVVYLDEQGLEKVDLISQEHECVQIQRLYRALEDVLKTLDTAARAAAEQIQAAGEVLTEPTGELGERSGSGEGVGRGSGSHQE